MPEYIRVGGMRVPVISDNDPAYILFPNNFGRGCTRRDYQLQPLDTFTAPPSEMDLIDPSEWDARYDEQEATQSSLQHIRMRSGPNGGHIPSLDQNGQGYSHTEDTEVLTERGWVQWPSWNKVDRLGTVNPLTHQLEFQDATEWHAYEYKDEMFYSTNRRLDFGVTRNHRMLVRKWDESRRTLSDVYTFQRADELGWYVGMMPAPAAQEGVELIELEIPGYRRYDGDDFLAMLSLIISDGYAGGSGSTENLVSFCCFNPKRYPMIAALARRIGFQEQESRQGVWNCRSTVLANWVRQQCYTGTEIRAYNKVVPDVVRVASARQIRHFLEYYGDQTHGAKTPQFFSTSKRLIDDLQELHLRIGKRSHIGHVAERESTIKSGENAGHVIRGKESYVLTVGREDRLCIDRKKHIETDRYKGLVYCATVPNGILVTRRNGSVLCSGNCWTYSTTMAVMLARAAAGLPYKRLSGHAIGCMVKNFRDEGGWGALSAQFARERGIPSVEKWVEKSMSRSNDNPATWEDAAKQKTTEEWVDLALQPYDQNLTDKQIATAFFSNCPGPLDFAWWGHSVCGLRWVRIERGSWGILILNSWTDSWGEKGFQVLRGEKAKPMGALSIRVVLAA